MFKMDKVKVEIIGKPNFNIEDMDSLCELILECYNNDVIKNAKKVKEESSKNCENVEKQTLNFNEFC